MSPRLGCAPNFRDLGGIATLDGRTVRPGRVFRGEVVARPDDADLATLDRCGIGLVFDLRSTSEAEAVPNRHWQAGGTEILSFNVGTDVRAKGSFWEKLRDDASPDAVKGLLEGVYRSIPLAVAPALTALFDRVAEGAPPLLIHCSAGKDRTGVVVAMLLHALGAEAEAVMTDYLETVNRITDRVKGHARKTFADIAGGEIPEESLAYLTGVHAELLQQSYGWMERKFGSVDAFLEEKAGLDAAKREAVRAALLS